jgi:mono/diheme cytochrome c family protein
MRRFLSVMAGPVRAIHVFALLLGRQGGDARDGRGSDDSSTRANLGAVASVVLGFFVAGIASASAQTALPQGEGRDLVAVACTQCHALTPIVSQRDGPAGWRRYVYNMVLRGAQLRSSEVETVITYLSANFGPGLQGDGHVALPNGPGKELIETRCTSCHDLERVAGVKRKKQDWPAIVANMVDRGAAATGNEAQTIAAYLAANFGAD